MGVIERRQREREALRERILEAASALFVEEGFESVSIRKIADKIEYAPSTLYLYFKDKTELLGTICRDTFEQLNERFRDLVREDLSPLDRLRSGIRAYIEFGIAHPNHYILTFNLPKRAELGRLDDKAEMSGAGLEAFDFLRQCIRSGMEAGAITPGDLETMSRNVWMFMHGATSLLITCRPSPGFPWPGPGALTDSAIELIVRGVQAGRVCHAEG